MYITYETVQYPLYDIDFVKRSRLPKTIPNDLPKPDFMPTKLVRISDMKVVDGSQVNEGYCALSYSWNQSGDILIDEETGKYKRIDEGKHKIIRPDGNYEYVKFEGIIQQICQRFNIKYIWYDQLCINQDNKEKQHEIRNMHHIYENAYCTVAFVPENSRSEFFFDAKNPQYFKRLWAFGEAIKSKRLLFVGRDDYQWGDRMSETYYLTKSSSELNVSQILYHAHQRTSTNDHDRVFALIHLFPEFINKIDIDYDQKLEDLMIQFYGLLAKKDISILYFMRSHKFYKSTIQKYKFLPSWTGVNGIHFEGDMTTTSLQNYDIIGKKMYVTTTYATNSQSIYDDNLTIRDEDIPPIPDKMYDRDYGPYYHLFISVQVSKTKEMKRFLVCRSGDYWGSNRKSFFDGASRRLRQLSRFMKIKKENLCWCSLYGGHFGVGFDDLTDSLGDPSTKYIILSEISFKNKRTNCWFYPVIKKKKGEEFYKAIGCCSVGDNEGFFSDWNLPKETFLIQ